MTRKPLSAGAQHRAAPSATDPSRRRFMQWSALAVAAGFLKFPLEAAASTPGRVAAVPLQAVRLKPSLFLDSLAS